MMAYRRASRAVLATFALLGLALVSLTGFGGARADAANPPSLPPVSSAWPFRSFQLGLADAPGDAADLTASAPFGMRYQYLAGGVNTGGGWQNWNTGGQFVDDYIADSVAHDVVPVFTYYMLLQSNPDVGAEDTVDLAHLESTTLMNAYWGDVKAFFQHAKTSTPVVMHVEPDLWGYIEQAATNDAAATVPAAVASSGFTDLVGYANNAAGFAKAFVHLRDLYAPNVVLAWHLSDWGTGVDIHANAPSDADTDALAGRAAAYYGSLGANFDLASFAHRADWNAVESRMEMRRPVTLLRRDQIFRLGLRAIESGLSLVQIVTPCDPGEKKKCRQSHDARHHEEPCPAHLL